LNVYSDNGEYFFSFVTPDTGIKARGTKDIPIEILLKASAIIFGED